MNHRSVKRGTARLPEQMLSPKLRDFNQRAVLVNDDLDAIFAIRGAAVDYRPFVRAIPKRAEVELIEARNNLKWPFTVLRVANSNEHQVQGETREQWSIFRVPIRLNLVRNTRDEIRQVLVSFALVRLLFSYEAHQELKHKSRPKHQAAVDFTESSCSELCSAHRAVARSWHRGVSCPVAGTEVNRFAPDAQR